MKSSKSIIIRHKSEIIIFALIFVLVSLIYHKTLNFDFVYFDDDVLILNKIQLMDDVSNIKNLLFSPVFEGSNDSFYRPVFTLSLITDTLIGGGEPGFYHYTNVLLHFLASCAVFLLFRQLRYSKNFSAAAALLFSALPSAVSAVAWIPGRNDILLALFALLSMIFFARSFERGKISDYVFCFIFFMSALFTKESAAVIPFIYIVYSWAYASKLNRKNIIIIAALSFAALVIYAFLRYWALSGNIQAIAPYAGFTNLLGSVKTVLWYNGIIFLTEKSILYPQGAGISYVGIILFFAFILLCCCILRKNIDFKRILFGLTWFIVFLIPTFIVSDNIPYIHRVYLPSLGYIFIAAELSIACFRQYPKTKKIFTLLFIALIAALAFISYGRIFSYQDRQIFWTSAFNENPHAYGTNISMSSFYLDEGDIAKAEQYAYRALEHSGKKEISKSLRHIARIEYLKKNYDKSEEYYLESIEQNKYNEYAYHGLSVLYEKTGNNEAAKDILRRCLELIPGSSICKNRLDALNGIPVKDPPFRIIWKKSFA